MTETEMKRYINAVNRRLNLPKEVKARVMSDFVSSINARREAGQTAQQIYAELGNARKAAADLNEQMKEFTYRKSPWRFLFAAMAAYGAAKLLGILWANILYLLFRVQATLTHGNAATVGIIGGADGPTAVFVTTAPWTNYLLTVLLLVVGIWGFLRLCKCKAK